MKLKVSIIENIKAVGDDSMGSFLRNHYEVDTAVPIMGLCSEGSQEYQQLEKVIGWEQLEDAWKTLQLGEVRHYDHQTEPTYTTTTITLERVG